MSGDAGRRRRQAVRRAGRSILLAVVLASAPAFAGTDPFFFGWRTFGTAEGLPSMKVTAVAVDGPRVFAGTEAGFAVLAGDRFETVEGLPFPVVTSIAIASPSGDVWIGTMGGLARYSAGRIDAFTQLDSGLANDVVYGVAVDGRDVWVATASGLNRYDTWTRSWELFDTTNTLMHEPWCYAVTAADDGIYVAVWGGGVVVRERRTGLFREHRDPDGEMEIDLFRDDGLVHDVTSSVALGGGFLWAGTYFGLSRYDGRRWTTYNQEDSGLAGDFINQLAARGDVVWIATDQGLSRFDSRTWHTWQLTEGGGVRLRITAGDGGSRSIPLREGPAHNTIYGIAVQDGDIWLATAAGLSHGIARGDGPRGSQNEGGTK